jgi:hypothetical protein
MRWRRRLHRRRRRRRRPSVPSSPAASAADAPSSSDTPSTSSRCGCKPASAGLPARRRFPARSPPPCGTRASGDCTEAYPRLSRPPMPTFALCFWSYDVGQRIVRSRGRAAGHEYRRRRTGGRTTAPAEHGRDLSRRRPVGDTDRGHRDTVRARQVPAADAAGRRRRGGGGGRQAGPDTRGWWIAPANCTWRGASDPCTGVPA